ncbi:MAG: gamma-glutamylcyclotransferase family protein [Myxococcota bacterium]
MRYAAYGTTLHPMLLLDAVESTRLLGTAEIVGWTLRFNHRGDDGSGKATLEASAASVHVAVYEIAASEMSVVERLEGPRRRSMTVDLGAFGAGVTFISDDVRHGFEPFEWHRDWVAAGAHYHRFPAGYVARIFAHSAIQDRDHVRRAQEQSRLARAQRFGP